MRIPTTSKRYVSSGAPCRSTQTRALRPSSRRFRKCTASTGCPNASPRLAFTSTNAMSFPRRMIRSISRCPLRKRCATNSHPSRRIHRAAMRSPNSPRACRCFVMGARYRGRPRRVSPEMRRRTQKNAAPARAARMVAGSSLMIPCTPCDQSCVAFTASFTVHT